MNEGTIRKAEEKDVSRIAEILVFSKRTHYRAIFHDDDFSFGVLQVLPAARELLAHPEKLAEIWVFDDGFVKGMIHLTGDEIAELYIDPFFEHQHIGSALMEHALSRILHPRLWVLEKNEQGIAFYHKHGFSFTGERVQEQGTPEYKVRMRHTAARQDMIGKIVRVIVDRPMGSRHPSYPEIIYPVNYGFIEDIPGGDGEEQDAYILEVHRPLTEFTGEVCAVIHREDDNEAKWVVTPAGIRLSETKIASDTLFQEKYFRSRISFSG
ncbi:MAG: GNAT family N-acetyltransferase [Anaerolineaceae bacterium]|nr:GNAT family N-acetyltransferase [Anaerolineaceae bacterium]